MPARSTWTKWRLHGVSGGDAQPKWIVPGAGEEAAPARPWRRNQHGRTKQHLPACLFVRALHALANTHVHVHVRVQAALLVLLSSTILLVLLVLLITTTIHV